VQLLVSNEDVQNYQQIKADLDNLRLLVEKSELWVYKGRSSSPIPVLPRSIRKRQSKIPENAEASEEIKKDIRMSESSSNQVSLHFFGCFFFTIISFVVLLYFVIIFTITMFLF